MNMVLDTVLDIVLDTVVDMVLDMVPKIVGNQHHIHHRGILLLLWPFAIFYTGIDTICGTAHFNRVPSTVH